MTVPLPASEKPASFDTRQVKEAIPAVFPVHLRLPIVADVNDAAPVNGAPPLDQGPLPVFAGMISIVLSFPL